MRKESDPAATHDDGRTPASRTGTSLPQPLPAVRHRSSHDRLVRLQAAAGNRAVAHAMPNSRALQRLSDREAARIAAGDEEDVARAIKEKVYAHQYADARRIAVRIGYTDTDDVAMIVVRDWSDAAIQRAVGDDAGQRLILTLFHHLMTGSVDTEERRAAQRLSRALGRAEDGEEARHDGRIMVFPWRNIAWTDVRQTVYEVEPTGNAQLRIHVPNAVLAYFHDEANLPSHAYTRGITIPATARIRIINHDNGRTEEATATRLLELVNSMNEQGRDMTTTAVVTGATFGLSGAGAAYGLAAEGTQAAGTAVRVATAVAEVIEGFAAVWGPFTTVIREHEGTLVEEFGEPARDFVTAVRRVNSIVSLAQGVSAFAQLPGTISAVARHGNSLVEVLQSGASHERDVTNAVAAVIHAVNDYRGSLGTLRSAAGELANPEVWREQPGQGGRQPREG